MAETIGYDGLESMLRGAIAAIRENHQMLSRLDSAIGDGDHGSAMLRSMDAAAKALDAAEGSDARDLFFQAGWGVMSAAGGATGPLLGSWLMGFADAVAGKQQLTADELAGAFEAARDAMAKQSKAAVGDKTMMDALVPAVEALRGAADAGKEISGVLSAAADAAAAGAERTRDMRAKFGKARNLGDRTLGHPDPGATSMSVIFRGFADGARTG